MGCGFSSPEEQIIIEEEKKDNEQQSKPLQKKSDDHLSPIYPSLPKGAEKHMVRNVYDGDTLTLTDERRVRFLGIDTPEIKAKQPFAEEAKEYTKNLCHKKEIHISFEGDKEDHYGRLLAFVWVPQGNGYLCVNEGIVSEGLAFVYVPNKDSKTSNFEKLIQLQTKARSSKKGLWKSFKDYNVFITANGSAFHKRECEHISKIKNLKELKATEAADKGLHPCRSCLD